MSDARSEGYKFRLGVFVVSGTVLLLGTVLALTAGRLFQRTVTVHMYFEESVQGLEADSAIKYRGVQVGRVSAISLRTPPDAASGGPRKTIIEVRGELSTDVLSSGDENGLTEFLEREIRDGLRVRLQWKDITGQKYLDLDYFDPAQHPAVQDLGFEPQQPWIPTAPSPSLQDIQRDLASTLADLSKVRFAEIGDKVEQALDAVNTALEGFDSKGALERVEEAAREIRDLVGSEEVREAVANAAGAARSAESAVSRLDDLLSRPEVEQGIEDLAAASASVRTSAAALEDELPGVLAELDATIGDVREAIRGARLPETTASLRETFSAAGGLGRGVGAMREDLRLALRDVSDASRAIERLARFLERNPQALLSGRAAQGGR